MEKIAINYLYISFIYLFKKKHINQHTPPENTSSSHTYEWQTRIYLYSKFPRNIAFGFHFFLTNHIVTRNTLSGGATASQAENCARSLLYFRLEIHTLYLSNLTCIWWWTDYLLFDCKNQIKFFFFGGRMRMMITKYKVNRIIK